MGDAKQRELGADDFAAFFRDVHDHDPFPWQRRLTTQVVEHRTWPEVIDLPTGTGKTAVLDTAVFALAALPRHMPRRIVFVIDRRIVVDQVCVRAQRIRCRIQAGSTPTLRLVRDRLCSLSDAPEPLGVAALRGGIPMDREWTQRPDQPWVVVSTVDQFGSRLLFRGYGVKPTMLPVHAALAGNDCLVILDEVHLSVPFAQTLAQVAALRCGPLPHRNAVVEMSATPNNRAAERFQLDPAADLRECAELRRRVEARKVAKLVRVSNHDALPGAVLKIATSIAKPVAAPARSVGVVVNRVRTAREIHRTLDAAGYRSLLLTGRMRPLDRADVLAQIAPAVDPERAEQDDLTIVVATQAIEVGADFDFDALITECASVDSLRQRFGRLDRRGTRYAHTGTPAHAWVIGPKSVVESRNPDPIYGDAVRATWEELKRRADDAERTGIDVGARALRDFPAAATAPRPHAPLLLATHLDAWTQTNPEPIVQPAVDWFLHGIDPEPATRADVSIVWRRDRSIDVLRLVPPRQAESLQVPIGAARAWLSNGAEKEIADIEADAGGAAGEVRAASAAAEGSTDWVRWEGFDEQPASIATEEMRPGDLLVVDPDRGGLWAGSWDPTAKEPIADLGDAAQAAHGRRATLRLDHRLSGMEAAPRPAEEAAADAPAEERIVQWMRASAEREGDLEPGEEWRTEARRRLTAGFQVTAVGVDDESEGAGYYVLSERHHGGSGAPVVDPTLMDGSDESGSLTGTGVTLASHLAGVADRAAGIARRLGLPQEVVEDLRLAGRLHDLGKVDPRFQEQLVGGDPVERVMCAAPLAKSLPGVRRVRRYPPGMRHELASVALLESNPDVTTHAHDRDLVLHLIGTHHGWCRPLPPVIADPAPQTLVAEVGDSLLQASSDLQASPLAMQMAERFWRLTACYGRHGLAWLEAVLRLADHQQSAAEAERT